MCFEYAEKSGNQRNGGNWLSNPHHRIKYPPCLGMTKRHAIISRRNIGSEVEQEFIFKVVAFIKNVNKFSIVKLHNEMVNVSV